MGTETPQRVATTLPAGSVVTMKASTANDPRKIAMASMIAPPIIITASPLPCWSLMRHATNEAAVGSNFNLSEAGGMPNHLLR
jgi:hypothetical protein